MIEITFPTDETLHPERFEFGVRRPAVADLSPTSGAASITPTLVPRWVAALSFNAAHRDKQAEREALFAKLSGQGNYLRMWHLRRPQPRGTLRGAPQLAATAARGASTLVISCAPGETLLAGDMLGVGTNGQVVMVLADAVAAGSSISVSIAGVLREAATLGTAIVWDRPAIRWVSESSDIYLPYGYHGDRFTVNLVEVF